MPSSAATARIVTASSPGRFEPFRNEAADGQATVAWLRGQKWFAGRLGTIGSSYLGYVQLALAADPPPELKAAVVQVGVHDPAMMVYPGGVFALVNVLSATAATFSSQGLLRATRAVVHLALRYKRAARILPVKEACRQALGEPVPDQTLAQYAALKANGCEVSLLVGPWPGHRLRLQVSGGAHPRFARNTGTGEPLATATRLVPTEIEVYHHQARPSALLLPAPDTSSTG